MRLESRYQSFASSLDPFSLVYNDFVDLSGLMRPEFPVSYAFDREGHAIPFPQNTRGFLYYHFPFDIPPAAGEIRFRLTTQQDPDSIIHSSAKDLLLPEGTPWNIPLIYIASDKNLSLFRNILLVEGLVKPPVMQLCREL